MKRTERGFRIYGSLKDLYGKKCEIVQSSAATINAVWIQNEVELCGPQKEPLGNAHLSRAMVRKVIAALQKFLDETRSHD